MEHQPGREGGGGFPVWPGKKGWFGRARDISRINGAPESARQSWSTSKVASEALIWSDGRRFCQPRNTEGVGEAASSNKSFSVRWAPGDPGGLRQPTAADSKYQPDVRPFRQSSLGLPSCAKAEGRGTCLHMPAPRLRGYSRGH